MFLNFSGFKEVDSKVEECAILNQVQGLSAFLYYQVFTHLVTVMECGYMVTQIL